jgi:hypothetical protein
MEDLITHAPLLFDDRPIPTLDEPPLPPAPSGVPKPKYDYGSSYTRSHTIPPRSQDGQDFTPTLPPRPGQSIHPSRRTNPQSSKSDTFEQHRPSSPLTQQQAEAQSLDPRSPDLKVDVPSDSSAIITLQHEGSQKSEQEDVALKSEKVCTDDLEVQSPKTPDTFATAESSPRGSPGTGMTSKPPSRPSTTRSPSPIRRISHDSG